MVVLLSDCYEEPAVLRRALAGLRARGHDMIVFHLIDASERDLPWDAPGTFEDSETGLRLPLRPDELRAKYQSLFAGHRAELARGLGGDGIDYVQVETDKPLDGALRTYLDRRLMSTRTR